MAVSKGGCRRPAFPAAESALGSHPCVALSSAQVLSEWITSTTPVDAFTANGSNPLNLLSHSKGSLQIKENAMNEHTSRTQDRAIASRGLQGVREAAQRDR